MSNFRSVEFWKESVMTLPDNAFFELLRTVFGKIKTPFNKQILMIELEKFLLRDDVTKNIACYISYDDTLVIAAVAALNEPTQGELETFFSGELSYAELHDIIVNLEERFILYRFFEESQNRPISRLSLNPVLKSILAPVAAGKSLLFQSLSANEVPQEEIFRDKPFLFDDRILAALLSFFSQNKAFFKTSGSIRRKIMNSVKTLFPSLPLDTIIGCLQILGLFYIEGETIVPDNHRINAFGLLSRQERLAYYTAGIICYLSYREDDPSGPLSPWLFRTKVRNYAEVINRLYSSMDAERLYPYSTLKKLVYIIGRQDIQNDIDRIIDAIGRTGIIVPVSNIYWHKVLLTESPSPDYPQIVMDTPFTFLVYPEIAYDDAIYIAAFSDIIEAGIIVRFELNRDSVVRAFNRGISATVILELLQKLSHNRINENLSFTLHDWEKQHGEVTLRRGLVLTLSPEQRHLAQTKSLEKIITETLAPGIYMLKESAEERAIQVLSRAGVAIIAQREESLAEESSATPLRHFFLPLHAAKHHADEISRTFDVNDSSASILIESFHSILKQMRLGGETRDELSARIDRRMVLCESQLKDAVVRYEKLEARGLDYVGKAFIAKQAITMQSPVEVICPGKQKSERIFGIPKALEKADNESFLIIEPVNQGTTVRIPLGKISLLRRIKKSIFEG